MTPDVITFMIMLITEIFLLIFLKTFGNRERARLATVLTIVKKAIKTTSAPLILFSGGGIVGGLVGKEVPGVGLIGGIIGGIVVELAGLVLLMLIGAVAMSLVIDIIGIFETLVLTVRKSTNRVIKDKPKSLIKPEDHLIMQLLRWKTSENRVTYISLCFALVGEIVLYRTIPTQMTSIFWMIILTIFLLFTSFINQRILKYRVAHGLYGTCYSEAKEIVAFILEFYRENSDSNGKPPKLVFTQEEIDGKRRL